LYMAPEQAEGRTENVGPAADVWALGVILYELLTGRLPFDGGSLTGTLRSVREYDPVPVRALRPEVPEELAAVVSRCLRKRRGERYPAAAALADALKRWRMNALRLRRQTVLPLLAKAGVATAVMVLLALTILRGVPPRGPAALPGPGLPVASAKSPPL